MLEELDLELNARGIHLVFAELKEPVKEQLVAYGLLETIDARRFYPTLDAAVAGVPPGRPTMTWRTWMRRQRRSREHRP